MPDFKDKIEKEEFIEEKKTYPDGMNAREFFEIKAWDRYFERDMKDGQAEKNNFGYLNSPDISKIEAETKTESLRDDPEIVKMLESNKIQNIIRTQKGVGIKISSDILYSLGEKFASLENVIIHTDEKAIRLCEMLNARAFAFENEIFFNSGEYNSDTREGRELLIHELSHIYQQQNLYLTKKIQRQVKKIEEKDYLPTENTFLTNLTNMGPLWRKVLLTIYEKEVKDRWDRLQKTNMPEIIKQLEKLESQYIAGQTSSKNKRPIQGVEKNAPDKYRAYITLDITNPKPSKTSAADYEIQKDETSTHIAIELINAKDDKKAKIETIAKDPSQTFVIMMNLRRLNDILTRLLVVYNVSTNNKLPINEVMALYRAEGNYGVPNSANSIKGLGIPSGRKGEEAQTFLALPPGGTLSNMVILLPYDFEADIVPVTDPKRKVYVINRILRLWFVQTMGLDHMGKNFPVTNDLEKTKENFANWSVPNWIDAGKILKKDEDDEKDNAMERWQVLYDNMEYYELTNKSSTEKVVSAVPKDPELLLRNILLEGMMLLHKFKKASTYIQPDPLKPAKLKPVPLTTDPTKEFSIDLAYFHYNMQTKPDTYKKQVLMSAILSASRIKNEKDPYINLKNSISNHKALNDFIKLRPTDAEWPSVVVREWKNIVVWFNSNSKNVTMISEYMTSAGTSYWSSYGGLTKKGAPKKAKNTGEHRGAVSRFKVLADFYKIFKNKK